MFGENNELVDHLDPASYDERVQEWRRLFEDGEPSPLIDPVILGVDEITVNGSRRCRIVFGNGASWLLIRDE